MRSKLGAALAGLTVVAGGAMIAGSATAQTYYYNPPPVTYYTPPPATGYYVAPAPGYVYDPDNTAAVAGAVIGSVIGTMPAYGPAVPVDRYGPDPNGMIAPDGHRIKCKLRSDWDDDYDHYAVRRVCS